jgi:hypothetical protein
MAVGSTSVVSPAELTASVQDDKTAGRTVAIKLTDLTARPHLQTLYFNAE